MDLDSWPTPISTLRHFVRDEQPLILICITLLLVTYLVLPKPTYRTNVKVPTVRYPGAWAPEIISRLFFNRYATAVINQGYAQYKKRAYKVLKPDGDLVVLSTKYAEELRQLPASTLNALEATFTDHVGDYTTILTDSHLHTETIQKKLTPAIGRLVPRIISELDHAFEVELPQTTQWVAINPYEVFLRLVARVGARIFIGEELCRDEAWLKASIDYTKNIFITIAMLRPLPGFLHPLVGRLLPSTRQLSQQLTYIKDEFLGPLIEKRRRQEQQQDEGYEKPDDFLQWMMDLAKNENEAHPHNLAQRLLGITSMAVVHTSAMSLTHALYDMLVMPELQTLLREEILTVNADWHQSTQGSLLALRIMDSFLKESQRFSPPGEVSFHRVVKQDLTLTDGLFLPRGTHICMAAGPISHDPDVVPEPERFDALRFVKENKPTSGLVSTGSTIMHFGLGRYACPGRFFAAVVMKAVLSRFLIEYDFKFEHGRTTRPPNLVIGDKIVPNVSTPIYIARRSGGSHSAGLGKRTAAEMAGQGSP